LASLLARLPDPPPEPVRLIGILLVSQGLLRLVFLAIRLRPIELAHGLNTLTWLSAALGVATTAAGLLALQRYALARELGSAFSAAGLIYQLHGLANVVQMGWASHLALTTWIAIVGYTGIDAAAVVVLWTTPYYRTGLRTER
jgi:hypothetical protein